MKSFLKINSVLAGVVLSALALSSGIANAQNGLVKGQVNFLRTHDPVVFPNWSGYFWFTLKGVSSAGSCSTWGSANGVLWVGRDKQMLSTILTAQASGLEVAVHFDERYKQDSKWCVADFVTLGNPAPLE